MAEERASAVDVESILNFVVEFLRKKSFVDIAQTLEDSIYQHQRAFADPASSRLETLILNGIAYEDAKGDVVYESGAARTASDLASSLLVSTMASGARTTLSLAELPDVMEEDEDDSPRFPPGHPLLGVSPQSPSESTSSSDDLLSTSKRPPGILSLRLPSNKRRATPIADRLTVSSDAVYDSGPRAAESPLPKHAVSSTNPSSRSVNKRTSVSTQTPYSPRNQISPAPQMPSFDNVRATSRHSRESHSAHSSVNRPRKVSHPERVLDSTALIKTLEKVAMEKFLKSSHEEAPRETTSLKSSHEEMLRGNTSEKPLQEIRSQSVAVMPSSKSEEVPLRQPSRSKASNGKGRESENRPREDPRAEKDADDKERERFTFEKSPKKMRSDASKPKSREAPSDSMPSESMTKSGVDLDFDDDATRKAKMPAPTTKPAEDDSADMLSSSEVSSDDEDVVKHNDGAETAESTASTDRDSDDEDYHESYSEGEDDSLDSTASSPRVGSVIDLTTTPLNSTSSDLDNLAKHGSAIDVTNSRSSANSAANLSDLLPQQPMHGGQYYANNTNPQFYWQMQHNMAMQGVVQGQQGNAMGSTMLSPAQHNMDRVNSWYFAYFETREDADCNIIPSNERLTFFNLKVIHRVFHTGFEESRDFPIKVNDIIAGRYQVIDYLGSAAFSRAVQCLDRKTNQMVCMKIIKNNKDFFDQCLDEVKLLKYVQIHGDPDRFNVVRMYDFFYFKEHLFIVCELLKQNLYEFYKYNRESGEPRYFTLPNLRKIARQCLIALDYMHSLGLIHCDLKPENILMKSYSRCEVKVIDLGSSCYATDVLSSYVQSRSYRAPEVLLGLPYGQWIDLWSLGCILAELFSAKVLFQNDSAASLLGRIMGIIGPIKKEMLQQGRYTSKYFTEEYKLYERTRQGQTEVLTFECTSLEERIGCDDKLFVSFLRALLTIDPSERPTAAQALAHPWFNVEEEADTRSAWSNSAWSQSTH